MGGVKVSLTRMNSGSSGKVSEIQGGHGMANRLSAIGIIPGKRITKIGSMLMKGPITIEIDRAKIAIGFGMASGILVELD